MENTELTQRTTLLVCFLLLNRPPSCQMRALNDTDFLRLWERGAARHPLDRALLALAAALPETPGEILADWPVGRRNQALARLRCQCFGPRLRGWLACVKCGEKLEFDMNAQMLAGKENDTPPDTGETVAFNDLIF